MPWRPSRRYGSPPWASGVMWSTSVESAVSQTLQIGSRASTARRVSSHFLRVRYVPSSENRSHGASLGNKLAPFCNGTRFRYVFR